MQYSWKNQYSDLVDNERLDTAVPCTIDVDQHRYPYSIVWTPIHPITWALPFVGHLGICDSHGICFDFTGAIGVDDLAFGSPTRFLRLNPTLITQSDHHGAKNRTLGHEEETSGEVANAGLWNGAIFRASEMFETRLHIMICGNDCHSHVAVALNLMGYAGFTRWNKIILAAWMFFQGRHTTWAGFMQTWFGPSVFYAIILWKMGIFR